MVRLSKSRKRYFNKININDGSRDYSFLRVKNEKKNGRKKENKRQSRLLSRMLHLLTIFQRDFESPAMLILARTGSLLR